MSLLLRVAAAFSALWAFAWPLFVAGDRFNVGEPHANSVTFSLAGGLAIAHLGFAYLFWRASLDPAGHRGSIVTALLVLGLRAAKGIYEVLYVLDGDAAVVGLIEMMVSLALFVGIVNALPSLRRARGG